LEGGSGSPPPFYRLLCVSAMVAATSRTAGRISTAIGGKCRSSRND
jgi:hypothetical protein